MAVFKRGQKADGKFSGNDMPPKPGPGDNPTAPAEDYSKVTYGDNVGPALPRGKNG
jgi:hypothetical protein